MKRQQDSLQSKTKCKRLKEEEFQSMFEVEKYASLFHSIQGATYKEKQKQLNDFLRVLTARTNNIEDYNALIKSITPKNFTEEIFKIDIMIALEQRDLLLLELKSCNRMFVNKFLANWKLFGEIFNDVTPEDLILNILPSLSYALQLKILNGVAKNVINEKLLDQYFNVLQEKYGLKLASTVLPGCSLQLIKSTIELYHIILPPAHFKRIFKRHQEFVDFYFEKMQQRYEDFSFLQYSKELKYVAEVNPNMYWMLQQKYNLQIKFGKYTTPKMIKANKDIIEKGSAALNTFHYLQMYKILKKEKKLDKFLVNCYPETHDQFKEIVLNEQLLRFLKRGPRFKQYYLLSSCFNKKYNKNLIDHPKYFTERLLEMVPLEEREIILDNLIKDKDSLICYYGTSKSIPKIKQLMQHCSNAETRIEYCGRLFDTCYVNNDKVAMLEVLQYVIKRYKNDANLLQSLCQKVRVEHFNFFTEEHCACLFTIIKVVESICYHLWSADLCMARYIDRSLTNQKSVEKIIEYYVQKLIAGQKLGFTTVRGLMCKKYQKIYCDQIAGYIDSYKDHEKYRYLCNKFLQFVTTSTNLENDDILQYERFFKELDQKESEYIIPKLIKYDIEIVHDQFWKSKLFVNTELTWYAKHRPDQLINNCDKICKMLPKYNPERILRKLKKFSAVDIIQEIVTHTLQAIQNEDNERIELPISALSILSSEMFMKQISTAYPDTEGKIDLEESDSTPNIQRAFVNSLKNLDDSSKSFPIVLKFCIGDYLKFALPSLYSITYNMKGSSIKDSLNQISNTAVSLRKHFLLLSRHLFSIEDFYLVLNEWSIKENNISIRNLILKKIVEYFIENPCERLWFLLKNNLNRIDSEDESIYDFLLKFQKIPLSYLPDYIEAIYCLISKNSEVKINKKRFQLANAIPIKIIDKLSHTFLQQLINDTVCNEIGGKVYWKCTFHVNTQKQLSIFLEVFRQFTQYVDKNRSNLHDPTVRSRISEFVCNFVHNIIALKRGGELIEQFKLSWLSTFPTENFLKDLILIEFVDLYLKSEFNSYTTGLKISSLFYEYIARYNVSLIEPFCQYIRNFLSIASLETNGKELFAFVDGFFKEKRDEHAYVAVIYLLPKTIPKIENAYNQYVPIFEAIKNSKVPVVRYHFDIYLSNCKL